MFFLVTHQIEAGFGEAESGDLQPTSQKRTHAQQGGDFLGAQHRFCPEGGIVMNNEVLQLEPRLRKETQTYRRYFHRSSEGEADGADDPVPQPISPRPDEAKYSQQQKTYDGHSAFGADKSHCTTFKVRRQRVSSKKWNITWAKNPTR